MALTRLAQNTQLRLRAYYDCNPPAETHWTCRVFIDGFDPDSRVQLKNRDSYAAMLMNPEGNRENLPADYLRELEAMPERMRRRFWLGQFQSANENALWSYDLLDRCRITEGNDKSLPDMQRIVIAVDPSGASGDENERSDEIGIVVVGLGTDGRGYLLEDLSGRFGPAEWGKIVVSAFDRHDADVVVAETNYGGAMVGEIIKAARGREQRTLPFKEVKASRGKVVRAEPISTLYEQGKVSHVGYFEKLEEQLCAMTTSGYGGDRSPDRADALIWALHEIFPAVVRRETTNRGPVVVNVGHSSIKQRLRR